MQNAFNALPQIFPPTLQPLFPLLFLLFLVFQHKTPNPMLRFLLLINLLTVLECINNPLNVVLVCVFFVGGKELGGFLGEIGVWVGVGLVDPAFGGFVVLLWLLRNKQFTEQRTKSTEDSISSSSQQKQIESQKSQRNIKFYHIIIILTYIGLCLLSMITINKDKYFNHQFSKNSGVTWLLYSHLFKRYLLLYQTILSLCPFLILYPVALLSCPPQLKTAVLYFTILYTHPCPTPIHIYFLYYLQLSSYSSLYSTFAQPHLRVTLTILTILNLLITVPTYFFYERLIWIWHNTHMISIGYYLVQLLLFWGVHSVYLAEILTIDGEEQEAKEEESINPKKRTRQYFEKAMGYIQAHVKQM